MAKNVELSNMNFANWRKKFIEIKKKNTAVAKYYKEYK